MAAGKRRWRKKHPGYDRRSTRKQPTNPLSIPGGRCKACKAPMLDPDPLCGFCINELPPYDKLRITEMLPGQDEQWHEYFSMLTNRELEDLIRQASLEKANRITEHFRRFVAPMMTDLYRRDGLGNLKGAPDHHRRCETCHELIINCKCEEKSHAAA